MIDTVIMITVTVKKCNSFSQEYYDSIVNSLQFHQLTCSCGRSGCLTIHAYYKRKVRPPDGSVSHLKILRVKCSECGTTHAVLPASIIPYSQISISVHLTIVQACENSGDIMSACTDSGSIDENNVKHIVRNYIRYWRQKLISECIALSSAAFLTARCFAVYSAQFMQVRRTVNILYATPT